MLCYGGSKLGVRALRHYERTFFRLALIGALAASLGVAACGRKGPLDLPPGASLAGDQATPTGVQAKESHPILAPDRTPLAPSGLHKPLPLAGLLTLPYHPPLFFF